MVIDMHAHLWLGLHEKDRKTILRAIELYDISRVYISALGAETPDKDEVVALNREASRFINDYPDRIGGFVYVSPEHDNAVDVVRRGIEEQGFDGVKLWVSTFCNDECVFPVVEAAMSYNAPILLHAFKKADGQCTYETTAIHVADLARRYPEAKFIMAHLGGCCYDAIPQIREFKNVYTDISGSIYRAADVDYTVRELGAERVLFGTDMPGSYLVNYGQVLDANLTEDARELIFSGNALKLFEGVTR